MNAFKEHLTSWEVGEAVAIGLRASALHAECTVLPVSDGGDGFLDCMQFIYPEAEERWCAVHGPDGKEILARYLVFMLHDRTYAAIEVAEVIGMRRVVIKHALEASSYGVGEMILHAISYGCTQIFLGLGGSTATDGGLGLLQAVGVEFYDEDDERIITSRSVNTTHVRRMETSHVQNEILEHRIKITCFCDGISSIGGNDGSWNRATQKGATLEEAKELQQGILHMIKVLSVSARQDISFLPMTGCAGGMGGGLYAAFGAKLVHGANTLLNMMAFDVCVRNHNVVITGEAIMDATTCTGKLPAVIAEHAFNQQIPCIGVAAEISCAVNTLLEVGFTSVYRVELGRQSFEQIVQYKLGKVFAKQAGMLIGNMLDCVRS